MKAGAKKSEEAPPQQLVTARLVSKTGPSAGLSFQISSERLATVGRAQGTSLIVPDRLISREHARIVFEGGRFILESLASTNGTFLNGSVVQREPLEHLDIIGFGPDSEFIFMLDRVVALADPSQPIHGVLLLPTGSSGNPLRLPLGTATFGRVEGNTIVLEQKAVSSQHARLNITEHFVEIEDLGSANGTTINERRLTGIQRLQEGDTIVLGRVASFVVQMQRQAELAPPPATGYKLVGEEDSMQLPIPTEPGHYVIGRESACVLRLENKKSVSRRHAEIEVCSDGRLKVRDLASGNGTLVNGVKIRESSVQQGDRIQVGLVVLRVEARE